MLENYFTKKKKKRIVITDFNLGYAKFPKTPLQIGRKGLKRECQTMERRKQKDDQCLVFINAISKNSTSLPYLCK